ncbi:hypothetical protein ACSFA0_07005 [Variovorax sp. LT1P1]|uniref:hypothetical protein n=1 Tax=Variovorax sp. LT1P1 TaxID=3443730 RepID=UPI003F47491D
MSWVVENAEWVFSGVGATVIAIIAGLMFTKKSDAPPPGVTVNNTIHNQNGFLDSQGAGSSFLPVAPRIIDKNATRILFIDDDTRFKVVKILKTAGWPHVKIVKDISSLDSAELLEATILFIDIQGVGKVLGFADEGLGLAQAIKKRHPTKKLVIYSSQPSGDRFHAALRAADSSIAKNADPYQFISLVEDLSAV